MNILMVTPYLPYPLVSGGQIRTYNLLKNLSKKHKITLFAYIRKEEERKYIDKLLPYCESIRVFLRGPVWTLKNVVQSQFSFDPLLVTMYKNTQLESAVLHEISTGKYQLIHVETFYVMPNIPKTDIPIILVVQTIEHLGYKEFTKRLGNPLLKPFMYWDVKKIRRSEEHYWRSVKHLIAMSDADMRYILQRVPNVKSISVVANGVDISHFEEVQKIPSKDFIVLFVGTFKWLPNVEAVTYLVEKVWGKVREKIPQAKLWIVGNSPTPTIERYMKSDASITVKGRVADIRDAYKHAKVLLAPVWSGKGTRYKILEAMATRTPIVATSLALEGLGIQDEVHALVGNTAQELVDGVYRIYSDSALAKKIADNGKKLVETSYEWESISKQLDEVYKQTAKEV